MKDTKLAELCDRYNTMPFISFAPDGSTRHSRLMDYKKDHKFLSHKEPISHMFRKGKTPLSIRSFKPEKESGNPFFHKLDDLDVICDKVFKLLQEGYYVIVNESTQNGIGEISGVYQNGVVELAPNCTPRFVEDPSVISYPLPFDFARTLLDAVHHNLLPNFGKMRVEFTVFPKPTGYHNNELIVWEYTPYDGDMDSEVRWPSAISRFIGDKVFGLLVADWLKCSVPTTRVFLRDRVNPFVFGFSSFQRDGYWTRTCPREQVPGKYSTVHKWSDPLKMLEESDELASVIIQDGVQAIYSGALLCGADGDLIIEGVEGNGDDFMQGTKEMVKLPKFVIMLLEKLYEDISKAIGPVRFEWAFDGNDVTVLQLHVGVTASYNNVIYPGRGMVNWSYSPETDSLDTLREKCKNPYIFISVPRGVGMTSHVADILRKSKTPSRIL